MMHRKAGARYKKGMGPSTRFAVALFATLLAAPLAGSTAVSAQPPAAPGLPPGSPITAIRADQWASAQAEAARYADPVAEKLVLYYRLLAPGAATPAEIAGFMHDSPDWPNQALLERHREEAVAVDPDDADVLAQCAATQPTLPAALLRCAAALANAGQNDAAAADARQAWITGLTDPGQEAAFLRRWSGALAPDDQWIRFQHLAWYDPAAASRQALRLDPARRKAAEARLAFQRDDPHAEALLAALPAADRSDPGLMLDHVRFLRRADRNADALALWQAEGTQAQDSIRAAAPEHLPAFWAERNILARRLLLGAGPGGAPGGGGNTPPDPAGAYALADAAGQTAAEPAADAEFLAGFIALRKLHDPVAAKRHFTTLATMSKAAITEGRAYYWLGRTAAAAGEDPKPDYARAAAWPTTFYGQLAALALGDTPAALAHRIDAQRDPAWTRDAVLAFAGHEVVRAAAWLVAWGDPHRARAFLLRMDELAPDPADRALTAALALRVGLPDTAVFVARRMGRDGLMLPQGGWPMPFDPPAAVLDPAVALGIMRQESSFDVGAVSPSGARGLMQLMPFTADAVAKELGEAATQVSLTADPALNMRLGATYLQEMLGRFGGSLPLAVAAYNAGPHRVDQWLAQIGDPRGGAVDMIDWLEEIPIGETRNYVQRVLENVALYRARRGEMPTALMAQATQ
jgi:soluble lytic murein transglycosylase